MNSKHFDTIVVGAGIAGICAAWWLKKEGQNVLLVDRKGPLAGASGAAGAFLSPRLGKGGPLQKLTDEAYRFTLDFYRTHTPEHFFAKGLVRIPKDEADAERFETYERFIDVPYEKVDAFRFPHILPEALRWGAFYFPDAAFVDPEGVADKLLAGAETTWGLEARPKYEEGLWRVGRFAAENLVLATGAQAPAVEIPYLTVGGVWGERVDVATGAEIPVTLHRELSVSANVDGVVRIGATHVRNDTRSEVERVHELMAKAAHLVPSLQDMRLLRIYAGHRASVNDHFPLVGPVADFARSRETLGRPAKSLKAGDASIPRIPGLYLLNGFGGRGFVFGPLMGRWLADAVVRGRVPDARVHPDRYLFRALRRG